MWDIVGHQWAVKLLARSIERGAVSHAYLFAGPEHIGKTALALQFAAALNCTGERVPCGECTSCRKIASGVHPDVRLISGDDRPIGIGQVREIQREAILSPVEGRWRVYVLTSFHAATTEAANCLLKTLEEPPDKVVLVLTATEADLLPPTVPSRCQVLLLHPLKKSSIEDALVKRWGAAPEDAALLARVSGGRAGWAIQAASDPALLEIRRHYLDQLVSLLRLRGVQRWSFAQKLGGARTELKDNLHVWLTWWRDVLLVRMDCLAHVVNSDLVESLETAAASYGEDEITEALKATRDTLVQLDHNVNPRLALEVLLLEYPVMVSEGA